MNRFILRYRCQRPKPPDDLTRIRKKAIVLDESSPYMLLVEAYETELKALIDSMPEWIMAPEKMIPLPEPHPRPTRREGKTSDKTTSTVAITGAH